MSSTVFRYTSMEWDKVVKGWVKNGANSDRGGRLPFSMGFVFDYPY